MLAKVFESGVIAEGDVQVEDLPDQTRMLAIPVRYAGRNIAVLTKEWIEQAGRRPGELERTYQTIFEQLRADDLRRRVPVPDEGRRLERRPARRRRRDVARRRRPGALPLAERQLGAAPGRHPGQRGRDAAGRARLPGRRRAPGLRAPGPGDRGVRAGRRHHAAVPLRAASSGPTRSSRACCSSATSPSCASATGCC